MENIIQEKIDGVLPYLRGFGYDENMFSRFTVLFPRSWDYSGLKEYIIQAMPSEVAVTLVLGHNAEDTAEDSPADHFFNLIGETIESNKREEKKRELLQQKMEELQRFFSQASLEDVESLKIVSSDKPITVSTEKVVELPQSTPEIKVVPPVQPAPAKLRGKIVPASERDTDEDDNSILLENEIGFTPSIVEEMERKIGK